MTKNRLLKSLIFFIFGTSTVGSITTVSTSCSQAITPNIVLSSKSIILVKGKSKQLTATIYPNNTTNKEVTWESSNKEVATVDQEGNVKGVNNGETTITVTTVEGELKATCNVTVYTPTDSIKLNKSELELSIGYSEKLIATISPEDTTDKDVVWTSSDESIVTVDQEGKVNAVGKGSATITISSISNPKII